MEGENESGSQWVRQWKKESLGETRWVGYVGYNMHDKVPTRPTKPEVMAAGQ